MRVNYLLAVLLLTTMVQAKEPKHYQSGRLMRMDSVKCGTDEKNGKSFAGEMIGTDSSHMKMHELLCQQYTLETSSLVYTVRPKDNIRRCFRSARTPSSVWKKTKCCFALKIWTTKNASTSWSLSSPKNRQNRHTIRLLPDKKAAYSSHLQSSSQPTTPSGLTSPLRGIPLIT